MTCRYHLDLCKDMFGEGISPNLNMTNIYYGGTNIAGMNCGRLQSCIEFLEQISQIATQFTNLSNISMVKIGDQKALEVNKHHDTHVQPELKMMNILL